MYIKYLDFLHTSVYTFIKQLDKTTIDAIKELLLTENTSNAAVIADKNLRATCD